MDSRVPENDDYGMRSFADSADESAQYLPPIGSQYSEVPTMDRVPGEAGNPQEFYNPYVVEGSPGDFEQFRSSPQHLPPPPSQHSLRYPQQD
ncbi:uncharacterized protein PAC_11805 [Phialocephala subalpina]|uniref:Uncharacterized protein n=1 Tax=Phialocephala subalpina TaxID=576137 RepID=A0A1L7XA35_9HELO|nr:uncharacterized protein PAC_11805 [Phialocephala subalpina]